jgi:protein-S-isoprenylcysteine O-methyltransferase Ste14
MSAPTRIPRSRRRVLLAASSLFASVPVLLSRMEGDLHRSGALRTSTAAAVWSAYTAYGGLVLAALKNGRPASASLRTFGTVGALVGAVLTVAGMRRFAGPAQLTGTDAGDLITGGIYRYSRNPQYVGLVALVAGLAVARRSPTALALAAGLAATFRAFVPVEERQLADQFGAAYLRYRDHSPRWIGRGQR